MKDLSYFSQKLFFVLGTVQHLGPLGTALPHPRLLRHCPPWRGGQELSSGSCLCREENTRPSSRFGVLARRHLRLILLRCSYKIVLMKIRNKNGILCVWENLQNDEGWKIFGEGSWPSWRKGVFFINWYCHLNHIGFFSKELILHRNGDCETPLLNLLLSVIQLLGTADHVQVSWWKLITEIFKHQISRKKWIAYKNIYALCKQED